MGDTRAQLAYLMWCYQQGYTDPFDREGIANWFLEDPSKLHPDDQALQPQLLDMAAEILVTLAKEVDHFVVYEMADGTMIYGEYQWVTDLDYFDDRDEEIKLKKRTYLLLVEEEVVLPDPYPIEEEEDDILPEREVECPDCVAARAIGEPGCLKHAYPSQVSP